jgi:hypothetical protein
VNGRLLQTASTCTPAVQAGRVRAVSAIALPRRKKSPTKQPDRVTWSAISRLVGVGVFVVSIVLSNAILVALYLDVVDAIAIHTWR